MGLRAIGAAMWWWAVLAACGKDTAGAASDADAPRSVVCSAAGVASVAGTGPSGALDAQHVYALAASGSCPDALVLVVTAEDPLAWPYRADSVAIDVPLPGVDLGAPVAWSGTFAATLSRPDGPALARGTLEVERGTSGYVTPTELRATARFHDGGWQFTATIDVPYCKATVCL
jgi:hypothetical protein